VGTAHRKTRQLRYSNEDRDPQAVKKRVNRNRT